MTPSYVLLVVTLLPLLAGAVVGAVTIRTRGRSAVLVLAGFGVLVVSNVFEFGGYAAGLPGTPITLGTVVLNMAGLVLMLLGLFLPRQQRRVSAPEWRSPTPPWGAPGYAGAPGNVAPSGFPAGPPVPGAQQSGPPNAGPLGPDERSPFEHQDTPAPQARPGYQQGPAQQPGGWQPPGS